MWTPHEIIAGAGIVGGTVLAGVAVYASADWLIGAAQGILQKLQKGQHPEPRPSSIPWSELLSQADEHGFITIEPPEVTSNTDELIDRLAIDIAQAVSEIPVLVLGFGGPNSEEAKALRSEIQIEATRVLMGRIEFDEKGKGRGRY